MLLETISYDLDFPIEMTICDIDEYPIHYHEDAEIIFVLKGSAIIKSAWCTVTMSTGDIYPVPARIVHGIRGVGSDNCIAQIHFNEDVLKQIFPDLDFSIYWTISDDDRDPDLDWVRELLLSLIKQYYLRPAGYLEQGTLLCQKIFTVLNERFILYQINEKEDTIRVNRPPNDTALQRTVQLLTYVTRNYASRLSLSELSALTGLSSYYMSHQIKEYIGISFRDMISLIRVSYSEAALYDPNKKISRIAKDVGFSTSRYYEEAFLRWFHCAPEEQRRIYRNMILDLDNLPTVTFLPVDDILSLAGQMEYIVSAENRMLSAAYDSRVIKFYKPDTQTIKQIALELTIVVTPEDYKVLGTEFLALLDELRHPDILISAGSGTDEAEVSSLKEMLEHHDYNVRVTHSTEMYEYGLFGYDTLAGSIHILLDQLFKGRTTLTIPLRDQGSSHMLLQGGRTLLTADKHLKPAFNMVRSMNRLPGKLKLRGNKYALVELAQDKDAYLVIVANYNEDILDTCRKQTTREKTHAAIKTFQNDLIFDIGIQLPAGKYCIYKYLYTYQHSLFAVMSEMDIAENETLKYDIMPVQPKPVLTKTYVEEVTNQLDLHVTLRGLTMQSILVQPVKKI